MPPRPKDKLYKKWPKTRSWRVSLLCRFAAAALIGCIIVPPGNAVANDSEAEVGIGGLVLRKNAHVEMRSEDLYVSAKEIRVRYRFYNKSGSDVRTVVAFPMPDDGVEFSTLVNGEPTNTPVERKALLNGVDRTGTLQRLGIDPRASRSDLDLVPKPTREVLLKEGLVNQVPGTEYVVPIWDLKTTYYWEQTFPAKKEITIDHRYPPIVGGYAAGMEGNKTWSDMRPGDELFSDYQKKYCIDRDFVRSARQDEKTRDRSWGERWISYILTTGGNWAGRPNR